MELYSEDTGSEMPPLLLLAGLATDELSWLYQKEPLAAQYRLITCDNRGVGRSPRPPGPYSIEEMASDVVALLDRLKLDKVHLLGHSMGGAIAQQLAISYPERVEKLILVCTFSHLQGRSLPVIESWAGLLKLEPSPELIGYSLFPWLYSESFLAMPGCLEACLEALRQHPFPLDGEAVASQVAALRGFDSRPKLAGISAPTLVLAAEHDLLVSPQACRELAAAIPNATYRQLDGTAHSCMLESPELFNSAVLEFL